MQSRHRLFVRSDGFLSRIRHWLDQAARQTPAAARRDHRQQRRAVATQAGMCESLENRRLMSVYFVSPAGANTNPGTLAAPFATIQQAASLAEPGDTVVVRAGTYHETVMPAHSGLPGQPIIYEPFGDGPVIVSGADPVSDWNVQQGDIYQTPISWDLGAGNNQVFVNGQLVNEARWPATTLDLSHPTFAQVQSATSTVVNGDNASTATLYESALTQPAGFWDGATVHIAPGQGWAFQTGTIINSLPGQITYTYTSNPRTQPYENPTAGNNFYLTGNASQLNAAGEWYLQNGELSLWTADSSNPLADDVEVKHRLFAFDLSGISDTTIRGFSIFAAGINTNANSDNDVLSDMNMQYISQVGIVPQAWGQPEVAGVYLNGNNDILRDSTIAYSATDGVAVGGSNDTVQGCVIHDTDYVAANFVAIALTGTGDTAEDNVVYNSGREGIRMNNAATVVNNIVHDVMLQTTDGGGIYTYDTDGTGGEIADNLVYNVKTGGYGGVGIYLDNNDRNWLVENNTVWNCTSAMKLNPVNSNDTIENNTLADSTYTISSSGSEAMPGTVFSNNVFTSSTVIGPGATELGNTRVASFTPPSDPAVNLTLAVAHGSFTPPVDTGLLLAADSSKLATDQAQLAADQALQQQALASDTAATNAAVAEAMQAWQNEVTTQKQQIAAETLYIRQAHAAVAQAAQHKVGAARQRLVRQLNSSIPTLAQFKNQLKAMIAADRAAIATAQADGQAKNQADQSQWSASISQDNQTLAADTATLQHDAAR